MLVPAAQVAEVVRRHPGVARARLVGARDGETDVMTLHCEVAGADGSETLAGVIADSLQAVCKLKGAVKLVAPGALANDGKVIEDARSYD